MIGRLIAIGTAALILTSTPFALADETFKARLSGDQEVPPNNDGTTGKFEIQFNRDFTEGEYKLRVNSGIRVTQAHLHCAPAGSNGDIFIFLAGFHALGWDVDGKWISNATVTNANFTRLDTPCGGTLAEVADAMNAGMVYVNVHSVARPGGVARGQIESNLH
jgi:hypothetical protein